MAKKVKVSAGGEKHVVYKKTNKIGKGKPGDIIGKPSYQRQR